MHTSPSCPKYDCCIVVCAQNALHAKYVKYDLQSSEYIRICATSIFQYIVKYDLPLSGPCTPPSQKQMHTNAIESRCESCIDCKHDAKGCRIRCYPSSTEKRLLRFHRPDHDEQRVLTIDLLLFCWYKQPYTSDPGCFVCPIRTVE
jgi:hypothetical protein